MEKERIHYGNKLRELVKTHGTQKEIAEKMGKSQSTLAECFNSGDPHLSTVRDICEACGTKAWTFIAHTETNIPVYMFELIEEIGKLSPEKQNMILKGLKPLVELAIASK